MIASEVRKGLRVRVSDADPRSGILAGPKFLAPRKEGAVGVVVGPVNGHDGAW